MDTQNKPNQQIIATSQEIYSGPLPRPQDLADYEKTYMGAAKIIFEAFEKQINYRI